MWQIFKQCNPCLFPPFASWSNASCACWPSDIWTSTHRGMCCRKTTRCCVFAAIIFSTMTVTVGKSPSLKPCAVMLKDVQNTQIHSGTLNFVCLHQQRPENSWRASISKDFCLKDQIYFCLKLIITQKLSMEIINRTGPTCPICYLMYQYYDLFETFKFKHIIFQH